MDSYLSTQGDNRLFRAVALLLAVFVLSGSGAPFAFGAPGLRGDPVANEFEAQPSPLFELALTTTVEQLDAEPVSQRPAMANAPAATQPAGRYYGSYTYGSSSCSMTCYGTCFGGATCSSTPTCAGSSCVATCASQCGGATYSSTCGSTCGSTCKSTCGSTCASTCGTTCKGVSCAVTCGDKCDDPSPPTGINYARLAGTDRYSTAVAISQAAFYDSSVGAPGVVIATGLKFPDALAGASLAYMTGPLLLVGTTMSAGVKAEITRLHPERAVILGSTKVVSAAIESYLKGKGIAVTRIGGVDRYDTAARIARATKQAWGVLPSTQAIIATGENFPDALAASPMSAAKGIPILLVKKNAVPATTKAMLKELGITSTFICGSTSAVSAAVEGQLPSPYRRGGADRYATMGMIVDHMWMNYGMGVEYFAIATGSNFPDALVGGAVAGAWGGVIYLTPGDKLHSQIASRARRNIGALKWVDVYGGKSVVYPTVVTSLFNLLE